jgi:FkbM family methyltransferase
VKIFIRETLGRLGLLPAVRKVRHLLHLEPPALSPRENLSALAKREGMDLAYHDAYISLRRKNDELRINPAHEIYLYDAITVFFDHYHSAVVPHQENGIAVADYSRPAIHRLAHSGVEFEFPSMPESDDSNEIYRDNIDLKPGDLVFDLGAYAGASTYFLAQAVGADGLVAAFEPDEINFSCLQRNVARHGLSNVKTFPMGIWSETTTLAFEAEGNMGSAPSEVLGRASNTKMVSVVSLEDAAALCGSKRVAAIKMDIEGAELPVLRRGGDFLRSHRPTLVIEPHRVTAGHMNTDEISEILCSYGYDIQLLSQGVQGWPLIVARFHDASAPPA